MPDYTRMGCKPRGEKKKEKEGQRFPQDSEHSEGGDKGDMEEGKRRAVYMDVSAEAGRKGGRAIVSG